MSTETTLNPVKYVKDLGPGEVFHEGTDNRLYQTEDGAYITSSWCPANAEYGYEQGETVAWESDDEGLPTDTRLYMFGYGHAATVDGDEPQHEQALTKFGYRVVTE